MSAARLAAAFAKGRAALICFVTAGDPDVATTATILDALVIGGADIIELGMPFTDPMADGPIIQRASRRSLDGGIRSEDIFTIATNFRKRHPKIPLILMGYANPMTVRGPEYFAERCASAGVDGVISVDIPPEEDDSLGPALRARGIAPIRLATPTSSPARLQKILDGAQGFLYYVSVVGITGQQQAEHSDIASAVAWMKAASTLPIAVGFGVRSPQQTAAIAKFADAVVVGSAIVEIVGRRGRTAPLHVRDFTRRLARAILTSSKQPQAPETSPETPPEKDLL